MHYAKILVAAIASVALAGCAGRHVSQMSTRYEKTSLPVHFDRNEVEDEKFFSVSVSETRRQKVDFSDTTYMPTHYSFENAGSTVDGNLLWEVEGHHFGLGFGISPADARNFHIGGFWGYSLKRNDLLLSWTGGIFLNNNVNHAFYEDWSFLDWDGGDEGEFHGTSLLLELPLRINAGFDVPGPVDPYASYSFNLLRIGIEKAGESVGIHEGAAGLLVELPLHLRLRLEASAMRAWMLDQKASQGNRVTHTLPGARVELSKEF